MNPNRIEVEEIFEILRTGSTADFEFVKSLVDGFPTGVDAWIGLNWITNAVDCGSFLAVQWMLGQGADVTFQDYKGTSVLHAAIDREADDKYEIMQLLIAAGADLNLRGCNDWTPLHFAAARNDFAALKILLDAGADVTVRSRIDDYATAEEQAELLGNSAAAKFIRNYGKNASS